MTLEKIRLRPSSAHRWLHCLGSVRFELEFPDETSEYAKEGTVAHEFAAYCLTNNVQPSECRGMDFLGAKVTPEMAAYIQEYIDFVSEFPPYAVEESFGLGFISEGMSGTCDYVSVIDDELIIIDLKYGMGVKVEAEDNPQLKLYALGALAEINSSRGFLGEREIDTVKLIIFQPRMYHVSEWETTPFDLEEFANAAKSIAKGIQSETDIPLRASRDACRFCRARGVCSERAVTELASIQQALAKQDHTQSREINLTTISRILKIEPYFSKWLADIKADAYKKALEGVSIPSYKLVKGRGSRSWVNETAAKKMLKAVGVPSADMYTKTLISPAQAEKLLDKPNFEKVDQVIEASEGRPLLVHQSDKRPAIHLNATEGFEDVTAG